MKKIIVTILAFVFIVTSTGAMVHMHYCMGKLADWGIGHSESSTCGRCGMQNNEGEDNGCCKDEHQLMKNDADQKITETGFQMTQQLAVVLPVENIEFPAFWVTSTIAENPFNHGPPLGGDVALYLRNCVFLI